MELATLPGTLSRWTEIGQAFDEWERLRVAFYGVIGIVAFVTLLAIEPSMLVRPDSLSEMAMGAVAANICFFAGHLVDCYATWLFGRLRWIRPVVFGLGTLGSVLLTIGAVIAIHLQLQ